MGRHDSLNGGAAHARASHPLTYFRWAGAITLVGLLLAAWLGWAVTETIAGALGALLICAVLAVLEISLSFDNAIVNANKLKAMSPKWQRRFLTWGMVIAVFGMRLIFPLAIVVLAAGIGPFEALDLAASDPRAYAEIMEHAHLPIAAFGGTFLMMVGLSFFFDGDKKIHWLGWLERRMARAASLRSVEIAIVLLLVLLFSHLQPEPRRPIFLHAALWGLVTFLAVEIFGAVLDRTTGTSGGAHGAAVGGLGAFLYLEMLDASFSFDGVVGAFALTQNLFLIAIGLGIGALYVRSMTMLMVDRGTLTEYRYLEHGAFYAIFALAVIMYMQTLMPIPEAVTGLGGAVLIALSFRSSLRCRH